MTKQKKKIPAAGTAKAPRTKWWEGDIPDKEFTAWLREEYGPIVHFQDDKVSDYLWPGLTDEQMFDPAFDAIARADYNKDYGPLIEFVRSNNLSEWGKALLADFLHRQLVRKRLPIYEVPRAELALAHAKKRVRHLMEENGISQDDAVRIVESEEAIPEGTLDNALKGKRHSARRAAKGFRGAASTLVEQREPMNPPRKKR